MTAEAATRRKSRSSGVALRRLTLGELARRYGGRVDPGAERVLVRRAAPLGDAGAGDLAPVTGRRFTAAAKGCRAALLVDASLAALVPEGRRWIHPNATYALAGLLADAAASAPNARPSRGAGAVVERGAHVDRTASIGPGAVVLAGAIVGPGCRIGPNAVVYGGVTLGARVDVGAGAIIGSQGFGWASDAERPAVRIPQLGGVVIEDDVAIGPLSTVDAGTLAPTLVGRGAKLDAHVHVAHNVVIGPGVLVAAQAGFAGSVRIGSRVLVGGQAGVADHVDVGDGARLAAKAGVIGDVAPGATVAGYPAVERARWLRATAWALGESRSRRTSR